MRIGYLVNRYPSPSHTFIRRELRAIEAAGVEVYRFSIRKLPAERHTGPDIEEFARTRVVLDAGPVGLAFAVAAATVRRPGALLRGVALATRLGWRSRRGLLRHFAYLAEACVLVRWLEDAGIAHLHAHFGTNPAAVAALARALGGPPFSFTVHGPEEFDCPEFLGLREKVRLAEFAVAISSFGRSQLYRWTRPEDWRKLHVVRCGLEEEFLRAPPLPIPPDPRLVCVARLSEEKGHLLLLQAAERLAASGIRFEMVLAGDGPLRSTIDEAIRRMKLGSLVRLAGWMSSAQVREAMVSARAVVLPSFAEGLPVVLMEALALGRPVITTAVGGIPELVEGGVTGWLVPAGSVEALAAAMRAALDAPAARLEEMGRAGARLVACNHDAAREARRLLALVRGAGTQGAAAAEVDEDRRRAALP